MKVNETRTNEHMKRGVIRAWIGGFTPGEWTKGGIEVKVIETGLSWTELVDWLGLIQR